MILRPVVDLIKANPIGLAGASASADRCLTLLIDGAALNMPEIHTESYNEFRANVGKLSLQIPDRLPDQEKMALIRDVLREFEKYRGGSESELRERAAGWRTLVASMFRELLGNLAIDPLSPVVLPLNQRIARMVTAEEIEGARSALEEFLRPGGHDRRNSRTAALKVADRTTANDNAAGLRGGGAAVEHLARVIEQGRHGFVVLFQLGCLDMICERFGIEAMQDCLMAVSAYLTHTLRRDDAIFHWSDSTLLAVVLDRPNEQILTAELERIASQNRDITISVGGRVVMLRIPLGFELILIDSLQSANDITRLSGHRAVKW
jgi:GGDEF domain-containing protein